MTWKEVERHLVKEDVEPENGAEACGITPKEPQKVTMAEEVAPEKAPESASNPLSQMLLSKLNFAKDTETVSASSTPPASPSSSGPQSSKTSPEVKAVKLAEPEASVVPPALKPLLNSVVWYTYQKSSDARVKDVIFLTNAAETANLARNFGIVPQSIHQLRALIGLEEQEAKNRSKYEKKHASPSSTVMGDNEAEPRPLFRYEEDEEEKDDSDEEVVVFKPRGRGMRGGASVRGSTSTPLRGVNGHHRSPVPTFGTMAPPAPKKPEIPVEAIDPDSFDRGSFGRGSVPLANTAPHTPGHFHGFRRGTSHRGNYAPASSSRGGFSPNGPSRGGFYRGAPRGFDRGSVRGRGRLFVP
jgi:hypothetical protein